MKRVMKRNGRIALSLWCVIEDNPYFDVLVEAVSKHIGPETAVGLKSAFALSRANEINTLLQEGGFRQIEMHQTQLDLPLPRLAEFVPRHIQATPMAAGFNQAATAVQRTIIQQVVEKLSHFEQNGRTQIPFSSHMVLCQK